jgi:hypothetical protein
MTLRRCFSVILWAVLGLGAVLALGLSPAGRALPALAERGNALWLSVSVVPRVAGHALALLVPEAVAQEQDVLEFKRVPDESVTTIERRPRRPALPAIPDSLDAPKLPGGVSRTGNIMRIGSNVHVEEGQTVSGDLLALGGDVTVDGHVEGDVVSMGGDVHLSSTARVDGDVASIGGELTEEEGAFIGGQRVTARGLQGTGRGSRARRIAEDVSGMTTKIISGLVMLFVFTLIAWGFASLAPGRTAAAVDRIRREPGLSMGIGALGWALLVPSIVALALVVAILCITIIGIPLAIAALFGYFVFLALLAAWGYAVSAVALGEVVARRTGFGAPRPAAGAPSPMLSLSRKAVLGVVVLAGTGLVGEFLKGLFFAPPLQGLGSFISAIAKLATFVAATLGAGALLRNEAVAGTFRRWWGGPKPAAAAATAGAAGGTSAAGPGAYAPPDVPPPSGYGAQATTPPPGEAPPA